MRTHEAALKSHYDNLHYYSPLDHFTFQQICDSIGLTHPAEPILDVGCGDGRLARRNPHLTIQGVDYNEHRAAAAGAACADLYEYLPTGEWATVVLIEVLEHLEEPQEAIRLARLAATDAVVATVPIDMPYVAHLQHWKHLGLIQQDLQPDRINRRGGHAVLYWSPL